MESRIVALHMFVRQTSMFRLADLCSYWTSAQNFAESFFVFKINTSQRDHLVEQNNTQEL